jgi:hypothetical protein
LHLGLSGGKEYAGTKNDRGQEKILVHSKAGSGNCSTVCWVSLYSFNYGPLEEQRFRARIPPETARDKYATVYASWGLNCLSAGFTSDKTARDKYATVYASGGLNR